MIHIGTAGWGIASRYLEEVPAGGSHLERYARVFTIVEVTTSFYRHHQRGTYSRWAQTVGDDFRFAVKLPKQLTHEGALVSGRNDTRERFLAEVAGLGGKLGALLVQLPPSLAFEADRVKAFFQELRREVPDRVALVCEPRHETWAVPAADALLRSLAIVRVAADPSRWRGDEVPGGDRRLAYFRLHGAPRIYYANYETARLAQYATQLRSAAQDSAEVWCIFDNTAHGHAVGNALEMKRLLHEDRIVSTTGG